MGRVYKKNRVSVNMVIYRIPFKTILNKIINKELLKLAVNIIIIYPMQHYIPTYITNLQENTLKNQEVRQYIVTLKKKKFRLMSENVINLNVLKD